MQEKNCTNVLFSVKGDPGLHWFYFTALYDWSRKLTPPSQQIRGKTKTNRDLVTQVLSLLRSLPVFTVRSHWPLVIFSLFNSEWPIKQI